MTIKFPFAYSSDKPTQTTQLIESDGYITLDYDAEKHTIGQIKLTKEK